MLSWWPVSWRTQAQVEGWPGSRMDCRVCACLPVCSRLVQMGLNGADVPYSPGIGRTRAELKVQKVSILVYMGSKATTGVLFTGKLTWTLLALLGPLTSHVYKLGRHRSLMLLPRA